MNILVADDNEDARLLQQTILEAQGHTVESAANGLEALTLAKHLHPDIIISDILMPEMDGFELCRTVKNDEKLNNIPFIFYTATFMEPSDERLAMALGASMFIIKPTETEAFIKAINKVIEEYTEEKLHIPEGTTIAGTTLGHMHNERLVRKLNKKVHQLEEDRKAMQTSEQRYRKMTDELEKIWKNTVGRELKMDELQKENEILKARIEELEGRRD